MSDSNVIEVRGKFYTIRVEVDPEAIIAQLGPKAAKNVTKRSFALHRAVKVTAVERK